MASSPFPSSPTVKRFDPLSIRRANCHRRVTVRAWSTVNAWPDLCRIHQLRSLSVPVPREKFHAHDQAEGPAEHDDSCTCDVFLLTNPCGLECGETGLGLSEPAQSPGEHDGILPEKIFSWYNPHNGSAHHFSSSLCRWARNVIWCFRVYRGYTPVYWSFFEMYPL